VTRLRVVIADDERPARAKLRRYLAAEPDVEIVAEASGGVEAVEAIRAARPDLVFLDVQMPDLDGFGVVEALGTEALPHVVFVTAHDHYALRAFEVHALDYVLKPVGPERFAKALARAREAVARRAEPADLEARVARLVEALGERPRYPERILVTAEERGVLLDVDRIDWVEADRNYVVLHAGGASHRMRGTIEAVTRRLDPQRFARVNRSSVVRLESIREVHPWFHGEYRIVLADGTELTWTRTHLDRASDLFLSEF
jgi:two-component system LytT family response regulator